MKKWQVVLTFLFGFEIVATSCMRVVVAQSTFSQFQFDQTNKIGHLEYFQVTGEDTTKIAEFHYQADSVSSPARDAVNIQNSADAERNIKELAFFADAINAYEWPSATQRTYYDYRCETKSDTSIWHLTLMGVTTRVRYVKSTGMTRFFSRDAFTICWADHEEYVRRYKEHSEHVGFISQ